MTAATATPAPVTAADMPAAAAARVAGSKRFKPQKDDALFSAYLDSEIKKNIAKTELIQLKKYKCGLEIKKLETELGLSGSDVVYLLPSEQWCASQNQGWKKPRFFRNFFRFLGFLGFFKVF